MLGADEQWLSTRASSWARVSTFRARSVKRSNTAKEYRSAPASPSVDALAGRPGSLATSLAAGSTGRPGHPQADHGDDVALDLIRPSPEREDGLAPGLVLEAAAEDRPRGPFDQVPA